MSKAKFDKCRRNLVRQYRGLAKTDLGVMQRACLKAMKIELEYLLRMFDSSVEGDCNDLSETVKLEDV